MMDLNLLEHLIPMKTLMILIVALYIIGVLLKHTPKVKDWTIPWILLVLGIICSVALQIGHTSYLLAGLQGIVCAFIAISVNQLYVQTTYKRPMQKKTPVAPRVIESPEKESDKVKK